MAGGNREGYKSVSTRERGKVKAKRNERKRLTQLGPPSHNYKTQESTLAKKEDVKINNQRRNSFQIKRRVI